MRKTIFLILDFIAKNFPNYYNSSARTSWQRRGLKKVPRRDLDQLIQRAILSNCAGTIVYI